MDNRCWMSENCRPDGSTPVDEDRRGNQNDGCNEQQRTRLQRCCPANRRESDDVLVGSDLDLQLVRACRRHVHLYRRSRAQQGEGRSRHSHRRDRSDATRSLGRQHPARRCWHPAPQVGAGRDRSPYARSRKPSPLSANTAVAAMPRALKLRSSRRHRGGRRARRPSSQTTSPRRHRRAARARRQPGNARLHPAPRPSSWSC